MMSYKFLLPLLVKQNALELAVFFLLPKFSGVLGIPLTKSKPILTNFQPVL